MDYVRGRRPFVFDAELDTGFSAFAAFHPGIAPDIPDLAETPS
jgi:hypothetical protein